ncbi:MAG TPA: hypothetical protein VLB12_14010, partial [Gemmatimonadales bacterium]|nr:hypothetical protein [Gemmatimonadales bacterium]
MWTAKQDASLTGLGTADRYEPPADQRRLVGVLRWSSFAGFGLLASLSCGGGDGVGPNSPTVDLSGDWIFEETLSDPQYDITCSDVATVTVTQTGAALSANAYQLGSCEAPGVPSEQFEGAISLTGTVSGTDVNFRIEPCPYRGRVYGDPPDSAAGTITCRLQQQGVTLNLRGHWLVRQGGVPPAHGGVDSVPPEVSVTINGPTVIAAGDSLHVTEQGSDAFGVAWLGYQIDGPSGLRDSTKVAGFFGQSEFAVRAESAWVATPPTISFFARDVAGHLTTMPLTGLTVGFRPTLSATTAATAYFANDSFGVVVHAEDDQALARIGFRVLGIIGPGVEDSVAVSGKSVIDTLQPMVYPGDLTIEIFARDQIGLTALDTVQVVVAPNYLDAFGTVGDTIYGVGEAMSVTANADPGGGALAWLGWRLGGPIGLADSVPGTGSALITLSTTPAVQPGWLGTVPVIVFARSRAGGRIEDTISTLRIVQFTTHTLHSISIASDAGGMAFDVKRDRLYLAMPNNPTVAVMALATATLAPSISLPVSSSFGAVDLDLTPGGDSLVVPLSSRKTLAIVNLTTSQIDTVPLNGPPNPVVPQFADRVRVTANRKIFTSLTFGGSGYGGNLVEYDLGTGTQQVRTDVGINGGLTERSPMARAGDGTKLLLLEDDSCCSEFAGVYTSASDGFGARTGTVNEFFPSLSGNQAGTRWLIGSELFQADLTPVRDLSPPGWRPGAIRGRTPGPSVL